MVRCRLELWFLDTHVIPFAKKLIDGGVLVASSSEYLKYAENNRDEWGERGHDEVEGMKQKVLREDAEIAVFKEPRSTSMMGYGTF
jgi:hypothetical protein